MDEEIKNEQTEQQPEGQQQAEQTTPPEAEVVQLSSDEKNMAMLCHLLGLLWIVGPLVVWLLEKDKYKFVDKHGKAALNWQISLIIYSLIAAPFCPIAIGFLALGLLYFLNIIFVVMAAIKASNGESYVYPLSIKFLK
ncbi:MAG: DUF4870 domain-containing protein [Phycisphaerae bacterium]|nr:DUF4870 domain-containing protein [Phycisphaerae bacterium]